ncbi:hypothetical protein ACXHXG_24655 [Rhizobium sp. LEGMi198b]
MREILHIGDVMEDDDWLLLPFQRPHFENPKASNTQKLSMALVH